ncbi:hypothetical protein Pmani_008507 [Petrolisthes manimaculis]|uniref:Nuclease HARBI1 n=1 Tax=Petrolisthes manimaculis TaxID=1843537 RepID=A0AAE1UJJ4_9EUCA|nr:hypothetical protein Pmani_008507 [Petrolisthes manimaculis]
MEKATFETLLQLLQPHLPTRTVSLEKKVLSHLWFLGNKESFRSVADRFNLSKGTLHATFFEVCEALKLVRPQIIYWPNRNEQARIVEGFLNRTGFPGVVGCIDGSYIPIPGPSEHRADYICRKGFPCIQLQAVCDHHLRFMDILTGWPGSVHDARVFRNSPLKQVLENGRVEEEFHLLGDSAYSLTTYMMVPFRDNGHLSEEEANFNGRHLSTRVVIERAFGLLKAKFKRLFYLDMQLVDKVPLVISSACCLHNFILVNEKIDVEGEFQNEGNVDDPLPIPEDAPQAVNNAAQLKRRRLANLLA